MIGIPFDCESLSGTSLPVGKYSLVIPIEEGSDHFRELQFREYSFL